MGTLAAPPVMYRSLAAWLTIGSRQTVMKSMYMISAIGRSPVMAAPTAAPSTPASAIGVSMTRSGKRSSRSISSAIAALIASRYFGPSGIDVLEHCGGLGVGRGEGGLDSRVHLRLRVADDAVRRGVVGEQAPRLPERVSPLQLEQLPLR